MRAAADNSASPGPAHYHLYGPALTFRVLGEPVGQGNLRGLGKGRPMVHQNAPRLLPWRAMIQHAAEQAITENQQRWFTFPLEGPVGLYACFTMPKAKSAPKTRITYPTKRPDGSHLLRAIEDAMTAAGVWRDDSQLVDEQIAKAFPGEHISALHVPGVLIRIYVIGGGSG